MAVPADISYRGYTVRVRAVESQGFLGWLLDASDRVLHTVSGPTELAARERVKALADQLAGGALPGSGYLPLGGGQISGALTVTSGTGFGSALDHDSLAFTRTTGAVIADLDFNPADGTSPGRCRIFRNTSTSGVKRIEVYRGDGGSTEQHRLASGADSYLCADNGALAVGKATVTSGIKLDVNGRVLPTGLRLALTSSAGSPTTTEYPTSGDFGFHLDTTSGKVILAYNQSGTIRTVALS